MSKVSVTCTYVAYVEIGDLSPGLLREALEKAENYSIFDFEPELDSVEVEASK